LEGAGVGFNGQACGITTQKKPLDTQSWKTQLYDIFSPGQKQLRTHARTRRIIIGMSKKIRPWGGESGHFYIFRWKQTNGPALANMARGICLTLEYNTAAVPSRLSFRFVIIHAKVADFLIFQPPTHSGQAKR
jgi:hypothetical protein